MLSGVNCSLSGYWDWNSNLILFGNALGSSFHTLLFRVANCLETGTGESMSILLNIVAIDDLGLDRYS